MVIPKEWLIIFAVLGLSLIAICAVVAGWAISHLLRLRWSGLTAATDAALAVGVEFVYVTASAWLRLWDPGNGLIGIVIPGLLCVLLRHLARRVAGGRGAAWPRDS